MRLAMAKLGHGLVSLNSYTNTKPHSFSIICLASIVVCVIASSIGTARAELPIEFASNGDDNQAYDQAKLEGERQDLKRQQPEEQTGKWTTFLENEEADDNKEASDAATTTNQPPIIEAALTSASIPANDGKGDDDDDFDDGIISQNPSDSAKSDNSHAKVVNEPDIARVQQTGTNQAEGLTSILYRFYKGIVYYFPFVERIVQYFNPFDTSQQNPVGNSSSISNTSSGSANSRSEDSHPTVQTVVVSDKLEHHDVPIDYVKNNNNNKTDDGNFTMDSSEVNAKPRVSIHLNDGNPTPNEQISEQEQEEEEDSENLVNLDNGIYDKIQPKETRRPTQVVRVDEVKNEDLNDDEELSNKDSFDNDVKGKEKKTVIPANLFKKSAEFSVPFSATDRLVFQKSSSDNVDDDDLIPGGLAAKYIYAPTHHYHLGNAFKSSVEDEESAPSAFGLSQAAHLNRIHAGDRVFGAYDEGPLKGSGLYGVPAKDDVNSYMMLNNKTNDFYFLVMVGAFCAMAMAVVLAAGLFAYRLQQNRKTNLDTDYPTYGVVGPNNLSGKCGAPAFVGGYFGGNLNAFGNKSGDTKSMPDSAIGATNSDKSCGKTTGSIDSSLTSSGQQQVTGESGNNYVNNQNAARMYHYQQQKQQMMIPDRNSIGRQTSASELDSEAEDEMNEESNYTVYECPGLASTHEMEIKNPLFNDDRSP